MKEYFVEAIARGIAIGKALVVKSNDSSDADSIINIDTEIEKFNKAVKRSIDQLREINNHTIIKDENFIEVHIMILEDKVLIDEVTEKIKHEKLSAKQAFALTMDKYITDMKNAKTSYLQDRYLDFNDIKERVLRNLSDHTVDYKALEKVILVVDEIIPSLLVDLRDSLVGVITKKGGYTSHGAILCRSWEIPYVVGRDFIVNEGDDLIIDTRKNMLIVSPTPEVTLEYEYLQMNQEVEEGFSNFKHNGLKILANVSSNREIKKVVANKLDGIGLYRTEFIFMNVSRPMTEDEQYEIYHNAVMQMKDKPICFRTFDVGDDKQLDYIKFNKKGFNNYVNNPVFFETQVKALIRSNDYSNIRIMFPMIETKEEFNYLKNWVLKIKAELHDERPLLIGMMLETKKALENLSEFSESDFFSLGTNDLTCELYHILRDEIQNYQIYISDLFEKLKPAVKYCNETNKCLSVCGELASVTEVAKGFLDLGIKNYSVAVSTIKTLSVAIKEYYRKNID